MLGGAAQQESPDLRRACERYLAYSFVAEHGLTNGWRVTRYDVEDARGQICFQEGLCDEERGDGRLFRRLQHHRAANGQRWRCFPGNHSSGDVPWNDGAANPHWLTHGQEPTIGHRIGNPAPVGTARLFGIPMK